MTDVAVVGPGAIGATFAAAAERAGHAVALCGRRPGPAPVVELPGGAEHALAGPVQDDPSAVGHLPVGPARRQDPPDRRRGALARARSAAPAPSSPCCRTASSTRRWSRRWPAPRPCCRRSCGAPRRSWRPGACASASPRSSACPTRRRALRSPRCSASTRGRSVADFRTEAWRKLCFNATAAPMVLTGRRAEVFREPAPLALARRLAEECVAVGRAEGAQVGRRDRRGDRRADRRAPARPGHVDAVRPARRPAAGVGRAQRRDRAPRRPPRDPHAGQRPRHVRARRARRRWLDGRFHEAVPARACPGGCWAPHESEGNPGWISEGSGGDPAPAGCASRARVVESII